MTVPTLTGTPGSNADASINGSNKSLSTKDKACPFCQQQFTSSSLGRHLDLYIKEKNPKPADGIHDIEEIRKLRGGITRRQPRNSMNKRDYRNMSRDTPGTAERRSPRPGSERERENNRSPSIRREDGINEPIQNDQHGSRAKLSTYTNRGNWENAGMTNSILTPWSSDHRSWDEEDRDNIRKPDTRSLSVSRKILAKTGIEQKQRMIDALDNAKAAELALREIVGSLRAAKQQTQGSSIFDFDPLTMDFPALCLHCLPPPPTLHTNTPIPSPNSWSLSPPEEAQYQALRNHFASAFHNYRISLSVTIPPSNIEAIYTPSAHSNIYSDTRSLGASIESATNSLEGKVNSHLQAIFRAWQALSSTNRAEIWNISLARNIALKSNQIDSMKRKIEAISQDASHLRQQIDELNRMQQPREFRTAPPRTTRIESETINVLGERILGMGVKVRLDPENSTSGNSCQKRSPGPNIFDQSVHIDTIIERSVGRWKNIVRETRKKSSEINDVGIERGAITHQGLSGESIVIGDKFQSSGMPIPNEWERHNEPVKNGAVNAGVGSDADADADMEEDDGSSFVEMVDAPPTLRAQLRGQQLHLQSQNHPSQHHQQQQHVRDQGFRLNHGNGNIARNISANSPCPSTSGGHHNPTNSPIQAQNSN
ncbi:Hypothetical protein BGHDH14_bgh01593 [Blumeria hordei DH14]|uniref:Uncharacterized protein n=1 Tax=Blumeria graminis f. sp. hordei (strain DH14) TaxID=546991 RepID=N1JPS0_BLUG1|nr:Hypothetical protein BGHDH14_bgh01593 [Blumeria hordei DH14]